MLTFFRAAVCRHTGLLHGKMSSCEQGSADGARSDAQQQNPAASCSGPSAVPRGREAKPGSGTTVFCKSLVIYLSCN